MANSKNKTTIAIALFLMATVAVSLISVFPIAKAQDSTYHSWVYCAANPQIVGVGQQVLLQWWTADMPPDVGETTGEVAGGRAAWYNIGWYLTDPQGNTETVKIERTDPVGAAWTLYTPEQVGTYTLQAWFPETIKTETDGDKRTYLAAVSPRVNFTVQEEQIQPWPETPLPTRTWQRPINSANREWYKLAGNWLGDQAQMYPYGSRGGNTQLFVSGEGPESAHILWTKPYYAGGIMDEMYGSIGYETAHYQGLGLDELIINGKLYYNYRADAHFSQGYIVADVYTGETLEYINDTMPSRGMIYNYESPNQHGGYPYMYRTSGVSLPPGFITESGKQTWELLDAYTGNSVCKIANVSFGTMYFWFIMGAFPVYGKDGSWCNYNIANLAGFGQPANYYLQMWNSTAIPTLLGDAVGTSAWQWRPSGGVFGGGWPNPPTYQGYYIHDGNNGFSMNVSLPTSVVQDSAGQAGSILSVRESEIAIIGTAGQNNENGVSKGKLVGLSLEPGKEGTKLWETTFTPPYASIADNVTSGMAFSSFGIDGVYVEDGVFTFRSPKQLKRWGYDLHTGEQLWESEPEVQMSYYGASSNYYEGKLYSYGYGGQIRCYNVTTGEVLWNYDALVEGLEVGYGGRYPIGIFAICDGKLYTNCGEHSPTQPLWRGQNLRCINATTGEDIWKILGFFGGMSPTEPNAVIADGMIVGLNLFDSEIYAFGKGPSATTVSAPQTVPTLGASVTISGTVTDQTETGRRNSNDVFEFSLKGTPAISDEDMSAWMEYMFMQQSKPTDVKGVEVVLETLDPNGNFYEIGRTTSDAAGTYGIKFTPEVPGQYQIIARFEGSAAYGPSAATAYLNVDEAPQATPTPTPPSQPSMADIYIVPGIIGIIVAIVAVGLVIILMLRKR
jgi:hypothetical protein